MNHRAHRNGFINRVDADVVAGEFAHKGQFFVDDFFAQVPKVEVDVAPIRPFKNIALALFVNKGTRQDVARPQFHSAGDVFTQVAFAFAVDEVPALAPRGFGHEDAGAGQARGVVLHKLEVFQGTANAVGKGHAVAVFDGGIGGKWKNFARAARAENDGFGGDGTNAPRADVEGRDAAHPAVVDEQRGDEPLVVSGDGVVFEGGLKEGVQHVEAGFVGGKEGAFDAHATKGADAHATVFVAAPGAPPMLELDDFVNGFFDKGFNHVLIRQEVAAFDGVVGVQVKAVVFAQCCCRAPFGRDRVASHGIDFGDHANIRARIGF